MNHEGLPPTDEAARQAALWRRVGDETARNITCRYCQFQGLPDLAATRRNIHAHCPQCGVYVRAVRQVPPDPSIEAQRVHYRELLVEQAALGYRSGFANAAFKGRYGFPPCALVTHREEAKQ